MIYKTTIILFASLLILISCQSNPYEQGRVLYQNFCENCHGKNGEGLKGLIPPLANADFYKNNLLAVPCIIYNGKKDSTLVNGKWYTQAMPGIEKLSEFEITNLLNYINVSWNNMPPVDCEDVRKELNKCRRY
jgi:mono/diheme cytochrome c family protein